MTENTVKLELVPLLEGKRVLLGVTGSIAAFKSVDLASKLTQTGSEVDVLMTAAAEQFVSPLTFRSVTGRPAYTEQDLWGEEAHVLHVGLARAAHAYLIAPATANTIFKLAYGVADSLVSLAALSIDCPLIVAPAMDVGMYANRAVRANIEILRSRETVIAGPAEGRMASGLSGWGRMLEPFEIIGHLRQTLGRKGPLAGHKIIVTAGGTQEPIDPVRVITNRSTGKQGFALAQAGLDRGAEVVLIAGETHLATPVGARRVDVRTAEDMRKAVMADIEGSSALLMAAAVADFRPPRQAEQKIKKAKGAPTLELEPTIDVLAEVAERTKKTGKPAVVVGFAAESQDLVENANQKLREKRLTLIVANDISAKDAGFAVDTNRATLIDEDGGVQELPLMTKLELADRVMERLEDFFSDTK